MNPITRNSEILYLYDARLTNPNGDPDDENRPRMDHEARRNLASDVRLKRYLRDYWVALTEEDWRQLGYDTAQDVWVRHLEEEGELKVVAATRRIQKLAEEFGGGKSAKAAEKDPNFRPWLLERLVDVRFFGATMPIKAEGSTGASVTLTGPVQFTWGYSLNHADILASSTITSHFAGRDEGEKGEHGTMGKDWRIKYSLLAFYGTLSAWRAKYTHLSERDVALLDHSMLKALPLMATTRSKIGQMPRLYLRLEYHDAQTFLGDLRSSLKLASEDGLEAIQDVVLDWDPLAERLQAASDRIAQVHAWIHPELAGGEAFLQALRDGGITVRGVS